MLYADIVALKNYRRIVAAAPDLQRASFYRETDFLHHGATVKFLPLLKPIEASYPSLRPIQACRPDCSAGKFTSLSSQHRRDLRSDAITLVRHILSLRILFADLEDVKVSTDMVVAALSSYPGCHAEPSLPRSSRIGPPHIHTKRCVS